MTNSSRQKRRISRILFLTLIFTAVIIRSSENPLAQRGKEAPVRVAEISERKTSTGAIVTLSADVPLSRAQTWQDGEGFHVTLPNTPLNSVRHTPGGIKARQVGRSLELLIPVASGSNVTLQPRYNTLKVIVNGGMDSHGVDYQAPTEAGAVLNHAQRAGQRPALSRAGREGRISTGPSNTSSSVSGPHPVSTSIDERGWSKAVPVKALVLPATNQPGVAKPPASAATPVAIAIQNTPAALNTNSEFNNAAVLKDDNLEKDGLFDYLFSSTAIIVFLLLACATLLIFRRRSAREFDMEGGEQSLVANTAPMTTGKSASKFEGRNGNRKVGQSGDAELASQGLERRSVGAASVSTILYGPYRVDQEVGKLILGQPHRMDVLSSRAPDDRRAIEHSLMKPLNARESSEDSRKRARRALEEYGFVARQSASLLMARNVFERVTAARALGEVGSELALPFVLEALYDDEQVVRTQAVLSLGSLKMPSAIGAILDMARRHPEMPAAILSEALNACSFEMVESDGVFTSRHLGTRGSSWTGEIKGLDPSARFEELPEWLEDESLAEALESLANTDPEARGAAARALANFPAQRSVSALSAMSARDPEASVRSAAISSLGAIDHESVFAPVLVALADESREVSAAAARTLNRLNFDRADAYVRIMETSDPDTLRNVARACIKAGIAKQGIERLASEDRRNAYEAFSLLSLLAKSNETEPILDAIVNHPSMDVRLSALHLLSLSGQPEVVKQIRQLSLHEGLSDSMRTALLDVVYKIDKTEMVIE